MHEIADSMASGAQQYVKPAVLRLDFAMDLPVSMSQNCKTSQATNVGSTPCQGGGNPCQTLGS